jgi:predicted metal-binding protein
MCPPACGNLEYHSALLEKYGIGLIVQTTGELDDDFDYEGMQATGKRHTKFFSTFRRELEVDYPNLLALGNGGCGLCEECSYPGVPCRRPSEATQSMEAFGLIVSEVCKRNGIGYYYGSRTITYTGCYLLK